MKKETVTAVDKEKIYIGLTGSFGSGCTELAKIIRDKYNLVYASLSDSLKEAAQGRDIPRSEFQNIGDDARKAEGNDFFARKALSKVEDNKNGVVFDSLKHPDEIEYLRKHCKNFLCFSIYAPASERWERVKVRYENFGLDQEQFFVDDNRDRGEDFPFGQQVNKCNLISDILINNTDAYPARVNFKKIEKYLKLTLDGSGSFFVPPTYDEILMNHAFYLSKRSSCLKRQVGSVICTDNYYIISGGYNDSPRKVKSCREIGECYRDAIRKCPKCGQKLNRELKCKCGDDLNVYNNSSKLLDLCRAVHAEENAILQIPTIGGFSLKDTKLFTTTFPCLLCTKKIITVGIREVVYVDLYPVKQSWEMLEQVGVKIIKYEGVMPRAFMRVFNATA